MLNRSFLKSPTMFTVVSTIPYLILFALSATAEITDSPFADQTSRSFSIDPKNFTFLKDGSIFQYISGSLHYFRIPRYYWQDRLEKAKAAGLDAIQTYIPWNYHEREEGIFDFSDEKDIEYFIKQVDKVNLLAIIRVGPYICAEWSFGGLPAWLLKKNPRVRLRSSDPDYYPYVVKWFDVVLPKLRPLLYENGGPIIMVQLENEYGSSTICDAGYMSMLYDLARYHLGENIILFTTDGPGEKQLQCGSPDQRYLATIDFGPTAQLPKDVFKNVERFRPNQPLINSEFYTGWFDRWGDRHAHTNTTEIISSLENLVSYSKRVNVNMYLFHGGTTFGFWNGNPGNGPVLTSYDFDAPLSEAGDLTHKFMLLRDTIHKIKQKPLSKLPENTTKVAYGRVLLKPEGHIFDNLNKRNVTTFPMNMEVFGQFEGFLVYVTELPASANQLLNLTFERFADIAHVYTSGPNLEDLLWHTSLSGPYAEYRLELKRSHSQLIILMENTGYINYGPNMWNNVKGLIRNVTSNGLVLGPWSILHVQNLSAIYRKTQLSSLPKQGSIYCGDLNIPNERDIHDTFIHPESFGRGLIFINGHNLGRFNQLLGPQLRLFVPKPFLREGINEICVLELHTIRADIITVSFYAQPLLGKQKFSTNI